MFNNPGGIAPTNDAINPMVKFNSNDIYRLLVL